jgi:2-dehydropantoate 2-reductase
MKIVVLGAGAIGSLFGAFLSKTNTVVLVGRTAQKEAIQKNGLTITGKTMMNIHLSLEDSIHNVDIIPDLLLVTVKSYDTEQAVRDARSIIRDNTMVLSMQNGLDNLEKIEKTVPIENILGGVTTHGAFLKKPGLVEHTGIGQTVIGEWTQKKSDRLCQLVSRFNEAGIQTKASSDLIKELWVKAIINSSINPLTAFFSCINGYLLENPLLECIVEKICVESTLVACSENVSVSAPLMIRRTKQVVRDTALNYSSMLQSVQQEKKTEIDAINGVIVQKGRKHGKDVMLNALLVDLVTSLSGENHV